MTEIERKGLKYIPISDTDFIKVETKHRKGDSFYFNDISFQSLEGITYIGTYRTLSDYEWMDYNSDIIAIVKGHIYYDGSHKPEITGVEALFDIKIRLIVEGRQEDLLEYYNQYFKKENKDKDKNIGFQKRLLIKKIDNKEG